MSTDDEQKNDEEVKDSSSSTNDEGSPVVSNKAQNVAAAEAAAATDCTPSSSCAGTKRKRDSLEIPTSSNAADLPIWVAGASPVKFVNMEELMEMTVALDNMAVIHEIAVNPEFAVQEKRMNPLERRVEECMKNVFWDKVRESFSRDPPDYSHVVVLLGDIKKTLLNDILTPQHVRLRSEIESMLDLDLLKQQLEKNCLDVRRLFENVVELLSRLCAPTRDELVNNLRQKTDNVDMLRGIFELLDLMKVDLANFIVKANRSVVEQHSAEYEREEFMKILEKNPELELSTMDWLRRHISNGDIEGPSSAKKRFEDLNNNEVSGIISDAYMELLEWNSQNRYPETLKIDHFRLEALAEKYLQLILCTSSVLVSCNLAGKDVAQITNFKFNLKNDVIVITNDINKSNIMERLEAVFVHCNDRVSKCCKTLNIDWTQERAALLKEQILQLGDANNHVRKLIRDRIYSFIHSMISNPVPSSQLRFPPGLSMVQLELSALTVRFMRLVNHNRQTFGKYYGDLIKKLMSD